MCQRLMRAYSNVLGLGEGARLSCLVVVVAGVGADGCINNARLEHAH